MRRAHPLGGTVTARPATPAAIRWFSMASRAAIAAWPHCAIISIPTAAIPSEMKWSRSPMSKRLAPSAKARSAK